ncbi:hypothetical protein GCM10010394_46640 [Streptomyces crystallinus]|uniref:AB hydrolase-1 domain-containing protein n=1 Tax=Streptomyces crystallinus TaxID=68191 RepID=A0ABP3RJ30_9ACTN
MDLSRTGYVVDVAILLYILKIRDAVVLGHSLGGVNAYQLAARQPVLVRALVVDHIGAEIDDDLSFSLPWPHRVPPETALGASRELPDGRRPRIPRWPESRL